MQLTIYVYRLRFISGRELEIVLEIIWPKSLDHEAGAELLATMVKVFRGSQSLKLRWTSFKAIWQRSQDYEVAFSAFSIFLTYARCIYTTQPFPLRRALWFAPYVTYVAYFYFFQLISCIWQKVLSICSPLFLFCILFSNLKDSWFWCLLGVTTQAFVL